MLNSLFEIFSVRWNNFVLITVFICMFGEVHAQNLQTDVQNAMRYAITYGVDEQTHRDFWTNLSAREKREVSESLDFLEIGQAWQYAFWESASKTVRARRVIRTENYTNAFQKLQKFGGLQNELDKAEAMLESIASGKPIELPPDIMALAGLQSNHVIMDETFTDAIRDNVGVAFDRIKVLFSEEWPPKQETFSYPSQNLQYTSSVRLAFNQADYGVKGLKAWEARQTLGSYNTIEVGVVDFSEANGFVFDHATILRGFDQMGIDHTHFDSGTWFGLPYQVSAMNYKVGNDKMYALSKTISDMRDRKTYSITVSSQSNLMDAANKMQLFMMKLSLYQ